jgi:cobalt-precorrin-5B (C1)-methyltransferase
MRTLRRGWTTGACAAAAVKAAYTALLSGSFPDPVTIALPGGQLPYFSIAHRERHDDRASAGIIKDAGDDPDVTHGALVLATVRHGARGSGVTFRAGEGVGMVTKPGLPVAVGEPAINPMPRTMIRAVITQVAAEHGADGDIIIEIAIHNGEKIAQHTMNPRLGILGGLSILGTTGIVVPYSCAAWIASIHEGIDVARATGITHIAASTGSTSEAAAARWYALPEGALIDMGDFVGGMLKYLRGNPIPRLTIAGGFAKLAKLAQGHTDLHSKRSSLDMNALAQLATSQELRTAIATANTGLHAWELAAEAGFPLGRLVAEHARDITLHILGNAPIIVDVLVVNREGEIIGQATPAALQEA